MSTWLCTTTRGMDGIPDIRERGSNRKKSTPQIKRTSWEWEREWGNKRFISTWELWDCTIYTNPVSKRTCNCVEKWTIKKLSMRRILERGITEQSIWKDVRLSSFSYFFCSPQKKKGENGDFWSWTEVWTGLVVAGTVALRIAGSVFGSLAVPVIDQTRQA